MFYLLLLSRAYNIEKENAFRGMQLLLSYQKEASNYSSAALFHKMISDHLAKQESLNHLELSCLLSLQQYIDQTASQHDNDHLCTTAHAYFTQIHQSRWFSHLRHHTPAMVVLKLIAQSGPKAFTDKPNNAPRAQMPTVHPNIPQNPHYFSLKLEYRLDCILANSSISDKRPALMSLLDACISTLNSVSAQADIKQQAEPLINDIVEFLTVYRDHQNSSIIDIAKYYNFPTELLSQLERWSATSVDQPPIIQQA